jgi:hypothetical protein
MQCTPATPRWQHLTLLPLVLMQFDTLKRSTKLLGMFVNRVNGAWAEAQQWGPPQVSLLLCLPQSGSAFCASFSSPSSSLGVSDPSSRLQVTSASEVGAWMKAGEQFASYKADVL